MSAGDHPGPLDGAGGLVDVGRGELLVPTTPPPPSSAHSSPVLVPAAGRRAPKNTPSASAPKDASGADLMAEQCHAGAANAGGADVQDIAAALGRLQSTADAATAGAPAAAADDAAADDDAAAAADHHAFPGLTLGGEVDPTLELLMQHSETVVEQLARDYHAERVALERKFHARRAAAYAARAALVNGTAAAAPAGGEAKQPTAATAAAAAAAPAGGLPQFWLMALKNQPTLQTLVKDRDEECLKYLTDVRCAYPMDGESPFTWFRVECHFRANPYFANAVLSKTYTLETMVGPLGVEPELVSAVGTAVEWKEGMDLTVRKETKRVRRKGKKGGGGGQQTRTIVKMVPAESFFGWFATPAPLDTAESEQEYERRCSAIEMDFEVGQILANQIVPNAVNWFTGEADDSDFDPDAMYVEGSDDDDDDDDDDSEEDGGGEGGGTEAPQDGYRNPFAQAQQAPGPDEQPECKTQ